MDLNLILSIVFYLALVKIVVLDFKTQKIRNVHVYLLILYSWVVQIVIGVGVQSVLTALVLLIVFLFPYSKGKMGGGDVKLIVAGGAWVGRLDLGLYLIFCIAAIMLIVNVIVTIKNVGIKQVLFSLGFNIANMNYGIESRPWKDIKIPCALQISIGIAIVDIIRRVI